MKKFIIDVDIINKSNINNNMKRYYTTKVRSNKINYPNNSNLIKCFNNKKEEVSSKRKDESNDEDSMNASSKIGFSIDFNQMFILRDK